MVFLTSSTPISPVYMQVVRVSKCSGRATFRPLGRHCGSKQPQPCLLLAQICLARHQGSLPDTIATSESPTSVDCSQHRHHIISLCTRSNGHRTHYRRCGIEPFLSRICCTLWATPGLSVSSLTVLSSRPRFDTGLAGGHLSDSYTGCC